MIAKLLEGGGGSRYIAVTHRSSLSAFRNGLAATGQISVIEIWKNDSKATLRGTREVHPQAEVWLWLGSLRRVLSTSMKTLCTDACSYMLLSRSTERPLYEGRNGRSHEPSGLGVTCKMICRNIRPGHSDSRGSDSSTSKCI